MNTWQFQLPGATRPTSPVSANTKSEARAIVKRGMRLKRLPPGTKGWYAGAWHPVKSVLRRIAAPAPALVAKPSVPRGSILDTLRKKVHSWLSIFRSR